jgi:hypothetical protein
MFDTHGRTDRHPYKHADTSTHVFTNRTPNGNTVCDTNGCPVWSTHNGPHSYALCIPNYVANGITYWRAYDRSDYSANRGTDSVPHSRAHRVTNFTSHDSANWFTIGSANYDPNRCAVGDANHGSNRFAHCSTISFTDECTKCLAQRSTISHADRGSNRFAHCSTISFTDECTKCLAQRSAVGDSNHVADSYTVCRSNFIS